MPLDLDEDDKQMFAEAATAATPDDGDRDFEQEAREHELAAERLERDAAGRRNAADLCRKSADYKRRSLFGN